MTTKNILLSTLLATTVVFGSVSKTQAAVVCQPIYGGGQSCVTSANLLIDKKVLNPANNTMAEGLSSGDARYNVTDKTLVTFTVTVSNTSSTQMRNVQVTDTLPPYVSFVGASRNVNVSGRTITYTVDPLNAGQSDTTTIQAKVEPTTLPQDQGVVCDKNFVTAFATNEPTVQDNTPFCIEKAVPGVTQPQQPGVPGAQVVGKGGVAPVVPGVTKGGKQVFPPPSAKTTPSTGPEALPLLSLIPTGMLGLFLRKKSILD